MNRTFFKNFVRLLNIFGYFRSGLHVEPIGELMPLHFSIFGDFMLRYLQNVLCCTYLYMLTSARIPLFAFKFCCTLLT